VGALPNGFLQQGKPAIL